MIDVDAIARAFHPNYGVRLEKIRWMVTQVKADSCHLRWRCCRGQHCASGSVLQMKYVRPLVVEHLSRVGRNDVLIGGVVRQVIEETALEDWVGVNLRLLDTDQRVVEDRGPRGQYDHLMDACA